MHKRPYLIAEVKTMSPFGYKSKQTWDELFATATEIGDMISVHTDPRWGGSIELVKKARAHTHKPLLAKGIHDSDDIITEALAAGATYALVVGRLPRRELLPYCLIEPNTIYQLRDFIKVVPTTQKLVWNSRNLSDGSTRDKSEYTAARNLWRGWLCQASNIATPSDIESSADAVLIGQNLTAFAKLL
ncbi:hypothetical protein KBD20_03120 [Candidatus Saccharibacteria bacterium]|nr:hypothetical protein [Candidatus Saccharibacteria bacterium]